MFMLVFTLILREINENPKRMQFDFVSSLFSLDFCSFQTDSLGFVLLLSILIGDRRIFIQSFAVEDAKTFLLVILLEVFLRKKILLEKF